MVKLFTILKLKTLDFRPRHLGYAKGLKNYDAAWCEILIPCNCKKKVFYSKEYKAFIMKFIDRKKLSDCLKYDANLDDYKIDRERSINVIKNIARVAKYVEILFDDNLRVKKIIYTYNISPDMCNIIERVAELDMNHRALKSWY